MKTLFVVHCNLKKNKSMKYLILIFSALTTIFSCKKNDDDIQSNPFIPNIVFDTQTLINTDLPQYNNLKFPGNYVILNDNYGLNGIVIYYAGGANYSAFDLTDPSHVVSSCSKLTVEGIVATCSCDDTNKFEILTGQPNNGTVSQYTLKRYFVEASGSIVRVYNN